MSKHVNEESQKKNKRKFLLLLILLLLIFTLSLSVLIFTLFKGKDIPALAPDYAPEEIDPEAGKTEDDTDNKLDAQSGGGAVSMIYHKDVKLDLSEETFSFYFKNPGESTHDVLVQIEIDGTVVAQSGRIPPGYELSKLSYFDNLSLGEGGYVGKIVALYYDVETREKAIMKSEIPLTVKVVR